MTRPPGTPGRAGDPAHSAPDTAGAPARRRERQTAGAVTPEACLRHDARRPSAP
jgi:hypothetical protein